MEHSDSAAESVGPEVNLSRAGIVEVAEKWCHQIGFPGDNSLEKLLTSDCIVEGVKPGGGTLRGPSKVQAVLKEFARLYPNKSCRLLDSIVEGPRVAFRWRLSIDTMSNQPDVKQHDVEGITILTTRDGRIAELWQNYGRWWI